MRKLLIAANWKMYKTPAEATAFLASFCPLLEANDAAEVVLFPSMTSLPAMAEAAKGTKIGIGAQTMHWLEEGAYTGETSPNMLNALGVTHVIIGHSERRRYFNETDARVNLKLKSAVSHGLTPIVCVGEHLEERQRNLINDVLRLQISVALDGIDPSLLHSLVIAYEPVWAIGTGQSATPRIAEDAHQIIRRQVANKAGSDLAECTRILYGGSVTAENAHNLIHMEDVDGALVGGASLDPYQLWKIIENTNPRP